MNDRLPPTPGSDRSDFAVSNSSYLGIGSEVYTLKIASDGDDTSFSDVLEPSNGYENTATDR